MSDGPEPRADDDAGGRAPHDVAVIADVTDTPPKDRSRRAVTAVAVGLRAIASLALAGAPVGLHDPLLYQRFGQGIAKGQGYVSFYGEPTSYYPPGYPFFVGAVQWVCDRLSLSSALPLAVALAQSLLGGLTVWAIVGVGDRLAPGDGARTPWRARWGLVAGALVAVWPNLVLHSTVLLSETLFLAVFSCFLLLALRALESGRWPDLVGAGATLGLAVLVRPQVALVLAGLLVAVVLLRRTWRQRIALVAVPILVMVVTVAPWTIRNAGVFDRFVPVSTNGGDNLCVGFHQGATGHFEVPVACDTGEFYIDGPGPEARRDAETTDRATTWARSHVGTLPGLSLRKLWYTYQHDHDALRAVESYEQDRFLPGPVRNVLRWVSDGYYVLVMVATVVGGAMVAQRWWRGRRSDARLAFLLVVTAASALVPVLFFGETRFKVPATPCFALLAAPAIMVVLQRERRRDPAAEPATGPVGAA